MATILDSMVSLVVEGAQREFYASYAGSLGNGVIDELARAMPCCRSTALVFPRRAAYACRVHYCVRVHAT